MRQHQPQRTLQRPLLAFTQCLPLPQLSVLNPACPSGAIAKALLSALPAHKNLAHTEFVTFPVL